MTALDELYWLTPTTQLYTQLLQCVNYVGPTSTTTMTTLSHTQTPQIYTVYLRANERRNEGQRTYRQAICVENADLEVFYEVLDFPVLRRRVLARSVEEARSRFVEWQAKGYADNWLLLAAWEVTA